MSKNKAILLFASALLALPGAIQAQGVTPTAAGKGNTVSADQLITRYSGLAGGAANAKSMVNGLRTGDDITLGREEKVCTAYQQTCVAFEETQTCVASTQTQTCVKTQRQPCVLNPVTCPAGFKDVCVQFQTTTTCTQWQTTQTSTCKQYQNSSVCATWGTQLQNETFSPRPAAPMGFGNVDIALALTEARLRPNATPSPAELKAGLLEILGKRAAGEGWGEIAKSYGFDLK
jgi:hypothetical protein